jgi:hypothetical protein
MSLCEGTTPPSLKDFPDEIHSTSGFLIDAVLASHGLPAGEASLFRHDDCETFLA